MKYKFKIKLSTYTAAEFAKLQILIMNEPRIPVDKVKFNSYYDETTFYFIGTEEEVKEYLKDCMKCCYYVIEKIKKRKYKEI